MAGIPALVFYILAVSVSSILGGSTNESDPVKLELRIIGGENAQENEFPHQILLLQIAGNQGTLCGASLLSNEWILTAAHCAHLNPGATFGVTAGKHLGAAVRGDPGTQTSEVKETFVHPCYQGSDADLLVNNDIALMKLTTPFTLNGKVKIIKLDEVNRAKPCTEATALGWGRIDPGDPFKNSAVLKKASIILPAPGICNRTVRFIHEESQQCVQEPDSSVCQGDSGGPLLCKDGEVNYVCGIASFVEGKNPQPCIGGYSVFVRVFYYLDWIKEVMRTERIPSTPCVPKIPPGTKYVDRREPPLPVCENRKNNTNSTAGLTVHGQPQHGFYIRMILTSLLFTY